MDNSVIFSDLQPSPLWRHFGKITQIPRPSGREEEMAQHILSWAEGRGHHVRRDVAGNLCVSVPASRGREEAPVVVLQSHLDMVCEKNEDSPYDAEKGLIKAVRGDIDASGKFRVASGGEWIAAEGTTLGADNGIGVATMLYVGEAEDIQHGPLELLFTLDEEIAMTGAKHLDPSILTGRILINLDSEDDGVLCVGCAGGTDTQFLLTESRAPVPAEWKGLRIAVTELQGGHSGVDIDKNRLNAIRAMVRVLQDAAKNTPLLLSNVRGGNLPNAIPRECSVFLYCPAASERELRQTVERSREFLAAQYRGLDDDLKVSVVDQPKDYSTEGAFSREYTNRLLDLLRALPTGVVAMSQDIRGLVETSSNLSAIRTTGDTVEIVCSSRSSVAGGMRDILGTLHALARLAGAKIEEQKDYPGWKPNMSSRVLALTTETYRKLFKADPLITAVHGGLECGLIGERVPGMDMVSFGPQITGAHAPGERVHIQSVAKFWSFLGTVLDDLSR